MTTSARTYVSAPNLGSLATAVAAAIAAGKQPAAGCPPTFGGSQGWVQAMDTLSDATYEANAADGALSTAQYGVEVQFLSKAGVGAYTLAAPSVAGIRRKIISTTANAHVVTATNLLDDGTDAGGIQDTATFAAFPGAAMELVSTPALRWAVVNVNGVTVA